jgi:hypothetical protein
MTQLQALENAVNSVKIEGLKINQYYFEDKRKKTEMYFLSLNNNCISPKLDYDNMNHFILGFSKALSLTF